ncbi:MAG: multiheme c-type cytochrome [Pirellulaceae bacterium]|nr:multiheme c-type cytochrome [Pirellulaceae bacterium]
MTDSTAAFLGCSPVAKKLTCVLICAFCVAAGCSETKPFDLSQATYVGQASCIKCHAKESEKWSNSHHDLAMQTATDETVLANFNNASLTHHGITSRMFRDGTKFIVNTEGPDGSMQDFEVKYVFGVDPLQQYMVEFPTSGQTLGSPTLNKVKKSTASKPELPRVQVLRLSWDTRKKEWFHLDPPDVKEKLAPTDDLHWTGIAQRWNNMCAECHSTDYQKKFNDDRGDYHSTFVEIDVSCEACHGPGSVHLELASKWAPGWNRARGYGLANLKLTAENQIQACAPCHSRRNVVKAGMKAGENYYDYYSNQLLTAGIYYPDGQVLDEDYVHGSFIQSKMYHKGIRCTDCHDPHTAKLKHDGNQLCTSCHQHPTAKYDSVAHHFHKIDSEGAKCVNCHMPTTTYMEVHARRDHSLRIPRPDLSLQIDVPNACTGCHLKLENVSAEKRDSLKLYQDWMLAARDGDAEVKAELDRANRYCDEACDKWYGEARRRDEHFGTAIAAGQRNAPEAVELLQRLLSRKGFEAPAIARATALQVLSEVSPEIASTEAAKLANDEHPLVRTAAMSAVIGSRAPTVAAAALEFALDDPVRSVRVEAARNLLDLPQDTWSQTSGSKFVAALNELEQSVKFNNDRGGAHLALGIFAEQQGRNQQAIEHYQKAIAVEPSVTGPRTNLAALLERNLSAQRNADSKATAAIKQEIERLRKEELPFLKRDVELLPSAAGIQYRYGLALYVDGQKELAATHLVRAAELEKTRAEFAQTAAMALEATEQWEQAIRWAKETVRLSGDAPENLLLLQRIEAAATAKKPVSP